MLLAILVVSALRRRDLGLAVGELSRETRRRDPHRMHRDVSGAAATGRAVERAAALERRRGGKIERLRPAPPARFTRPDPEITGISRRQLFNRSIVTLMALSLAGFGGAILAFLWPRTGGGFGSVIRVGPVENLKAQVRAANGFLYRPHGRIWVTEYPAASIEKARTVYSAPELVACKPASSRCTRSARTSAAEDPNVSPRSGSSARATARSTIGSARSAAVPRRAAWIASR